MALIKKSITITDQQEAWIQEQLETGQYASDSEIIREALREKQARTHEAARFRAALVAAEQGVQQGVIQDDMPGDAGRKVKSAVAMKRKARG